MTDGHSWTHPLLLSMLAPDREDADQEGEGGHDDLPWLGGAELAVTPEHFPEARGEHRDCAGCDQAGARGRWADQGGGGLGAGGQGTAFVVTREGSETQIIHILHCWIKYTS